MRLPSAFNLVPFYFIMDLYYASYLAFALLDGLAFYDLKG